MGAGGASSGGTYVTYGHIGDLKSHGKPNSRVDLYSLNGELLQKRWYGPDGRAKRNRDYKHGGKMKFPHDHIWNWNNKNPRGKKHEDPDYVNYEDG